MDVVNVKLPRLQNHTIVVSEFAPPFVWSPKVCSSRIAVAAPIHLPPHN